jgi:hypothetical protein
LKEVHPSSTAVTWIWDRSVSENSEGPLYKRSPKDRRKECEGDTSFYSSEPWDLHCNEKEYHWYSKLPGYAAKDCERRRKLGEQDEKKLRENESNSEARQQNVPPPSKVPRSKPFKYEK